MRPQLEPDLLIALPKDGSPCLAMGTQSLDSFYAVLERMGYHPGNCWIGPGRLAQASLVGGWEQIHDFQFRDAPQTPDEPDGRR